MKKSINKKAIIGVAVATLVAGTIYGGIKKQENNIVKSNKEQEQLLKDDENRKIEIEKEKEKKEQEELKRLEDEKKEKIKIEEEKKKQEAEKLKAKKKEEEAKKQEEIKASSKPVDKSGQTAQKKPKEEAPKKENQNIAKPETLADKVGKTKTASRTNQIITVIGNKVSLWDKKDGKFVESIKTGGRVGYGGMTSSSNKREGDGKTPTGVFPILYGFGTGGNPGTSFQYRQITQNSYFVDDVNSKYYNQWYEGTDQKGEHLIKYSTQYKYGLVIGYNMSNTPGKGSAIFLHCNGSGNTAGCVSVSQGEMLKMMKQVKPGAQIIITTSEENLKHY